jgi:uncharacterized membrane-anchored protein
MTKRLIPAAVLMAIAFQIVVLAGEYLGAVYPLWTGQEIKLKIVPVDPRSLFRGNYARLGYSISTVDLKEWRGAEAAKRAVRLCGTQTRPRRHLRI